MGDRVTFTGVSAGVLAAGSLTIGASAPWLCGALALAAVVAFRLSKVRSRDT